MIVLVTGATGFVGRVLVERLLADGRHVRATIRHENDALPAAVEPTRGDFDRPNDWTAAVTGVDAIVHLAARVHVMRDAAADPLREFRRVNVEGTMALARAAAAAGVRRFVFVSSVKVHGDTGRFSEDDAPRPQDPYGVSKREAEDALRALGRHSGLEIVIVRPPLVYGPGVRANFAALMRAVARGVPLPLGAIDNRRSLIGVDNLVDFLATCLIHPAAAGETFLVSDGEDLSTPELIRRMADAVGAPARLLPVPAAMLSAVASLLGKREVVDRLIGSLEVDIGKTRRRLSWTPPVGVEEGLRRAARGRT